TPSAGSSHLDTRGQDRPGSALPSSGRPKWRNWQTRRTQNPVSFGTCGFDPHLRHSSALGRLLVVAVADVLGDELLERLQLLVELFRSDASRRCVADEPGRSVDGRLPGDLLGRGAVPGRLGLLHDRLDAVEVHVVEAVSLLLVVLDPRPAPLGGDGVACDRLLERRVLVALVVTQDEARLAGLGTERLHLLDLHRRRGHERSLPAGARGYAPSSSAKIRRSSARSSSSAVKDSARRRSPSSVSRTWATRASTSDRSRSTSPARSARLT